MKDGCLPKVIHRYICFGARDAGRSRAEWRNVLCVGMEQTMCLLHKMEKKKKLKILIH